MARKPQNTTGKNKEQQAPIIDGEFEILDKGQAGGEKARTLRNDENGAEYDAQENDARFYTNPPDYATADEYTRALLDARIERLDPTNLDTIYNFGQDSIEGVNEVSKKIADSARKRCAAG